MSLIEKAAFLVVSDAQWAKVAGFGFVFVDRLMFETLDPVLEAHGVEMDADFFQAIKAYERAMQAQFAREAARSTKPPEE